MRPLTGDQVTFSREPDGTAVIRTIGPRSTLLERIDKRGRAEGIAANLSVLAVVIAPKPAPDWQLVDRYLVTSVIMGIDAILIRNKLDIVDTDLDTRLADYGRIGYQVYKTNAKSREGTAALAESLDNKRGVLVGQSGVGKSSLLNTLLARDAQAVGSLSEGSSLGRHTTTATVLYRLPQGGELIDSPGVRRYAPNISQLEDLQRGFVEFRELLGQCRFNDCRHRDEPDCAIQTAAKAGKISPARYASYLNLCSTLAER